MPCTASEPMSPPGNSSGATTKQSVVKASRAPSASRMAPSWRAASDVVREARPQQRLEEARRGAGAGAVGERDAVAVSAGAGHSGASSRPASKRVAHGRVSALPAVSTPRRRLRSTPSARRADARACSRGRTPRTRAVAARRAARRRRDRPPAREGRARARAAAKARRRVERAVRAAQREAAAGHHADAAPRPVGDLEHLLEQRARRRVAAGPHGAAILDLDARLARFELLDRDRDAFEDVDGLEAGRDDRQPVARGDRLVLGGAHHGADVAGGEERLDARVRSAGDRLEGGRHAHVGDEQEEVVETAARRASARRPRPPAPSSRSRRRGRRRARRRARGEARGVERRVDDAHVAAARAHAEEIAARARDAQHVAEAADDRVAAPRRAPRRGRASRAASRRRDSRGRAAARPPARGAGRDRARRSRGSGRRRPP